MSDIIEEDVLADLRKSEHFFRMFDETTDCEGDIKVNFLKLHECLTDRVWLDAETISGIVIDYISQSELLYTQLRGIGTDGAAVMTGRLNGAVTRLQRKQLEVQENEGHKCETGMSLRCENAKHSCAASRRQCVCEEIQG